MTCRDDVTGRALEDKDVDKGRNERRVRPLRKGTGGQRELGKRWQGRRECDLRRRELRSRQGRVKGAQRKQGEVWRGGRKHVVRRRPSGSRWGRGHEESRGPLTGRCPYLCVHVGLELLFGKSRTSDDKTAYDVEIHVPHDGLGGRATGEEIRGGQSKKNIGMRLEGAWCSFAVQ